MSSTRRVFLASTVAALTEVTGCLQTFSGDGSPTTTTTRTTDTFEDDESTREGSTTTDPEDFDISFVGHAVQRSAFWPRNHDVTSVWSPPDYQLLFVMVTVEGGRPENLPLERFALQVEDRTVVHAETVEVGDSKAYWPEPNGCDCSDEYDTYARFPLPAPLSVESGEIVWNGPETTPTWSLPESALSSLVAETTAFELVDVETPSSTGPGEEYDVAYEVENVGEATGTARAALSQEGPLYGVLDTATEEVAPGESLTRRVRVKYPGRTGEAMFVLSTVGGDSDLTVPVV